MQKKRTWITNSNIKYALENRKDIKYVKYLHFKNGQDKWQHGLKQHTNDEFRNIIFKFQTGYVTKSGQIVWRSEYKNSENENAVKCLNWWVAVLKSKFRIDKINWWEAGQDGWIFAEAGWETCRRNRKIVNIKTRIKCIYGFEKGSHWKS